MAVNSPNIRGTPAIVWGTQNRLNVAGAIVESITITPKNGGPLTEIENGDGAGVSMVMLEDGFDATVRVVHDTNIAWPTLNANVVLSVPNAGGNGALTNFNTFVSGTPKPDLARKREAMYEIPLTYRPGIA